MSFPRWPRCYSRYCMGKPQYAQDMLTFFLIGRWVHTYNMRYKVWFPPGQANDRGPGSIARTGCRVDLETINLFLKVGGLRAWRELLEDVIGIHFQGVVKRFLHALPVLKRIKWLVRISQDNQDWTEFDRAMERPRTTLEVLG